MMTQIVSVWFPPADRLLGVAADVGVAHQRGPGLESSITPQVCVCDVFWVKSAVCRIVSVE